MDQESSVEFTAREKAEMAAREAAWRAAEIDYQMIESGEARSCHRSEFPGQTGMQGPPSAGFVVSGGSALRDVDDPASVRLAALTSIS
jgi:hypothetical protein